MRNHALSVGIGLAMLVVGLVLWLGGDGVDVPVVSLPTVGVVLAVLGGLEVVVSAVALALPATRHRDLGL